MIQDGFVVVVKDGPTDDWRGEIFPRKAGSKRIIGLRRVAALLALVVTVAAVWHLRNIGLLDPTLFQHYVDDQPTLAVALFVAVYCASVAAMIPTLPLNLAAGMFWGPIGGGLIAATGASVGALVSFAAARLLFRKQVAPQFERAFLLWIQQELQRTSWRFVAFLRINPVIPTGPLNYVLGLTALPLRTYCWATFVFLLPPSLAIAWIGKAMGSFVIDGQFSSALRAVFAICAAASLLLAMRWLTRHLRVLQR